MRVSLLAGVVVALSVVGLQTPVWGQTGSTMFGSTSTSGRSFAGSSTTGGILGSAGSGSLLGSGGVGGMTGSGTSLFGTSSQGLQSQGFVGAAQASQSTGRMSTRSSLGTMSGLQSTLGRSSGGQTRTTRSSAAGGGGSRTTTQIRATLRMAVSLSPVAIAPPQVSNTLSARLSQSQRIGALSPVQVLLQGQTATLRGAVATDYDRALAQQVMLLEPGVSQVKNELVVAAAPAGPELSPSGGPAAAKPPATPPAAP
jgi:hypothetical protein